MDGQNHAHFLNHALQEVGGPVRTEEGGLPNALPKLIYEVHEDEEFDPEDLECGEGEGVLHDKRYPMISDASPP